MKKHTVFLKGGFGNQLFQLSFAKYLQLNGLDVDINLSFLKDDGYSTPRRLIIPLDFFDLKEQNFYSKIEFLFFNKIYKSNKFKFFSSYFENYKFTNENDNFDLKNNKKFFFNGYWKDLKYIEPAKQDILNSLLKNKEINKGYKSEVDNNFAMIHVRRGDFLRDKRALSESYYLNSLKIMKKYDINKFDIFTDDEKWVKTNSVFDGFNNIFPQRYGQDPSYKAKGINSLDDKSETIKTFGAMLRYNHFVLSNSSYSFWAAFLKSSENSVITIPDPMFKNEERTNIFLENWNLVENK